MSTSVYILSSTPLTMSTLSLNLSLSLSLDELPLLPQTQTHFKLLFTITILSLYSLRIRHLFLNSLFAYYVIPITIPLGVATVHVITWIAWYLGMVLGVWTGLFMVYVVYLCCTTSDCEEPFPVNSKLGLKSRSRLRLRRGRMGMMCGDADGNGKPGFGNSKPRRDSEVSFGKNINPPSRLRRVATNRAGVGTANAK